MKTNTNTRGGTVAKQKKSLKIKSDVKAGHGFRTRKLKSKEKETEPATTFGWAEITRG